MDLSLASTAAARRHAARMAERMALAPGQAIPSAAPLGGHHAELETLSISREHRPSPARGGAAHPHAPAPQSNRHYSDQDAPGERVEGRHSGPIGLRS